MPSIPLEETRVSTSLIPVLTDTESYMVLTTPVNMTPALLWPPTPRASRVFSPISLMMCGCRINAQIAAMRIDSPSTVRAGILRAIITPVRTGTVNVHSEMLNFDANVSVYMDICAGAFPVWRNPSTRKITNVITNEGTVVNIRYLICWKRGVPAMDDAITVVSESGEILSPK